MSTEQSATETAIDEVTFCTRASRDVYTLEWDEGGRHRSEQIGRCGDPWAVGSGAGTAEDRFVSPPGR